MKVSMRFKDYVELLQNHSNTPLSLNRLTYPFGVTSNGDTSRDLLIGHVLEVMLESFDLEQSIDFLDVATAAWELGHDPAGPFLDEAPYLAFKIAQEEGSRELH